MRQDESVELTFSDLGIPFPLFEAPASEAVAYRGLGTCSLCHAQQTHCFGLDIGGEVVITCARCGTENGLDANERNNKACRSCGEVVEFPSVPEGGLNVCYQCLRAGRAAISHDTELGMVGWEQAITGLTHGLPGLQHPDFELVVVDDDGSEAASEEETKRADDEEIYGAAGPGQFMFVPSANEDQWIAARVPSGLLLELVRTPDYLTLQSESWLFCCKQPMVYLGPWVQRDFDRHAPDGEGRAFFMQIVEWAHDDLWGDQMDQAIWVYAFRCRECGRFRAHWDVD
jgi:uncharacterized protein CbrC (UPF0167 family)